MEVPGPDSDWRSPQFRQKVVAQIEEAMRKAGTAHTKSSNDMENHVYVKAKSREEYLSLVARLIIHFRDIHKKTLGGPDPMNALTNLTGVGGSGAIGMGPRPTGAPVGGMGAMGSMQIGQHAMAGVAGNPQAIGGPGQMPMQQMVQTQQQQQQQQQSIQFQQFQQAQQQQQQQQQNAAIQQQFQVQQQLRVQQMQQQQQMNQQLQQQHQNQQQQQAQNQQQQNQSQNGNESTSGVSTASAVEAADSRQPPDIQPTSSGEVISPPSSVSQTPGVAQKRKRSENEDPDLLQNNDEFSRFGRTVGDMLRRLPEERRDQAMFDIHRVLMERQKP